MNLMRYVEKLGAGDDFCVAWCDGGKSFVINHPDEFTRKVVPLFFKATKFSSFTRKLYRWQFRQINRGIGPDDPIIFGNEFFQRDKEELIAKMRSVTASGAGKHDQSHAEMMSGMKRAFDCNEGSQKRMMFGQFFNQQKSMTMMQGNVYTGMNPNGSIPLSNALRPGLNLNTQAQAMSVMGGSQNMMMVPQVQVQNGQSMMMNPMVNQMVGPMAPLMRHMGPMNPTMHQMPQLHQQQLGNSENRQFSQANQSGQTHQPPQSTADIVNAAIAALRHAN